MISQWRPQPFRASNLSSRTLTGSGIGHNTLGGSNAAACDTFNLRRSRCIRIACEDFTG